MTTITEETVANMSDVEKAKTIIKLITNVALCEHYNRKVDKLTLKEVAFSVDLDPQKKLYEARDTLVDADDYECIPVIIAKCVKQHNELIDAKIAEKQRIAAERQAKADALTESAIADLFDSILENDTTRLKQYDLDHYQRSKLSCSLEMFAAISDNSAAISYFKYYLIDDARITCDLVYEFLDATNHDDAFSDIEDMLSYLRSDFSDAIANKDWEALEDIKERISRISF